MFKKHVLFIFIICILVSPRIGFASSWQNMGDLISGTWGKASGQFGLYSGDSIAYDSWPVSLEIYPWGWIMIGDDVNKRTAVYKTTGEFLENVDWKKTVTPEYEEYERVKYTYSGEKIGFVDTDFFWTEDNGTYRKYDSNFNLIETDQSRPLEIGKLSAKRLSATQWHYEIEYPDGLYLYDGAKDMISEKGIMRINQSLLLQNLGKKVYAYKVVEEIPVQPGEKKKFRIDKTAEWVKPADEFGQTQTVGVEKLPTLIAQYGEAVIGPDGSIYTWKRTPEKYSIIKWTWQN